MWLELIAVGYWVGMFIYNRWFAPKPEREKAAVPNQFQFPRAEEGDPIPLAYGTVRISSPKVVWFGDMTAQEVVVDDVFMGYRYYVGLRLVLARGNAPIDSDQGATFLAMLVGDHQITGILGPGYTGPNTPGCDTYYLAEPDLFGGDGAGGEVEGRLFFYTGTWSQTRHVADIGHVPPEDASLAPPYRGQVVIRLHDWNVGEAPQIQPYSFVIHNPVTIPGHESATGPIGDGDANPAAILYDLLTNPWGGVSSDSLDLDESSFLAAAATLEQEQHGASIVIDGSSAASGVVEQVLRQIDGILYEDPETHKYVLKLVREDYDVGDLPVFDESNIVEDPELSSSLYEETVNEVRVIWTDPNRGFKDSVALAQDQALVNAQGGRRSSAEYRLPGITNAALAYRIASRELNFLSRPISKLRITVNRAGFDLRPGDPFVFSWAEWNFSLVFRVSDFDLGTLDDGRITINAVQDRFAVAHSIFEPDPSIIISFPTAKPIARRLITEAPRWIQLKAFDAGVINDPDVQRGYYLAAPAGDDILFKVRATIDGAAATTDAGPLPFPASATVETAYARTLDPYDTSTGLRLTGLLGTTAAELVAATATETQISQEGRNLGYCNGEILSWESATDLGGGVVRLNNVARGRADTVPKTLPVGADFFFVGAPEHGHFLGSAGLAHDAEVTTRTQGGTALSWVTEENSPYDEFTVRSRALLPYPPADLTLQTTGSLSKSPATLVEGGVRADWRKRDRLSVTLTRGDASDETVEAGTTYSLIADKDGRRDSLVTGLSAATSTRYGLGSVGHGTISVEVQSERTDTLPNGEVASLTAWDSPSLPVEAPHWRNLLLNGRFANSLDNWTHVTGSATVTTGSNGLGGAGSYLTDAGTGGLGVDRYQDVDISGYDPIGLSAVLDFYVRNIVDTDDTITVTLQSLDAGGSALQTQTYGASVPGTSGWVHQTLTISGLHASTAKLRVRVVMTCVGEVSGTAGVAFTEAILRVGQVTSQLLSNPDFAGNVTGWTAVSGSWLAVIPTPLYTGANAAASVTDTTSVELRQDVSVPAGFEVGSIAVLECAMMGDATGDTGEVIVEARSSGGSTLASTTTGAVTGTINLWTRYRLTLELPAGTATVRVRAVGVRVSSPNINRYWDDFDLRLHKHLDPDHELELSFEEPTTQALPRTVEEWRVWFPNVPPPDYAIFDGGLVGRIGTEPLMEADDDVLTGATCVVRQPHATGAIVPTTTCYENPTRQSTDDVHTVGNGLEFANFRSSDSFTALAFFKVGEHPLDAAGCGLMGRIVGGIGWSLHLNADGYPTALFQGAIGDADITLEPTVPAFGGGLAVAALTYDAANTLLHVVANGENASVDTSAIGEIRGTTPGKFRLLRSQASQAALPGQLVRAYLWRRHVTPADLQSVMTYARDPSGAMSGTYRTGSIAVVTETDATGALVETFHTGQVAIGLDQASGRRGLVCAPQVTNLAPPTFADAAWSELGADTVALAAAVDPSGYRQAAAITSEETEGFLLGGLAVGAPGDFVVAFFARADVAHDARVSILNTAFDLEDSAVVTVTTTWELHVVNLTRYDGESDGIARILWSGSDDGTPDTIYLSPLVFVGETGVPFPGIIPIGSPTATAYSVDQTLSTQYNHEGEIEVELVNADVNGTIADLWNGVSDNDRRLLAFDDGDGLLFSHYDGSGSGNLSDAGSAVDPTTPYVARVRWCRASLPDKASPDSYTRARAEQGGSTYTDDGRSSAWTPSTTEPESLMLGAQNSLAAPLTGRIFRVRIGTRERKVAG